MRRLSRRPALASPGSHARLTRPAHTPGSHARLTRRSALNARLTRRSALNARLTRRPALWQRPTLTRRPHTTARATHARPARGKKCSLFFSSGEPIIVTTHLARGVTQMRHAAYLGGRSARYVGGQRSQTSGGQNAPAEKRTARRKSHKDSFCTTAGALRIRAK